MIQSSIIIINYNTSALTLNAVKSVYKHSQATSFEIIIVDNGSEAEDFLNLKKKLEFFGKNSVQLIRSRINTGFGGGNMLGVQRASGSHYVFMNSDAQLLEDSLAIMLSFLEKNPGASLVGIPAKDENGKLYKAFDHPLSLRGELFGENFLRFFNPKKYPRRRQPVTKPMRVGTVSGSFFMVRAADFDAVGGFDTNLFLYYEEKDLSFRIEKMLKKETVLLPNSSYLHLKGKSSTSTFDKKKELRISQFYTVQKNLGAFKYCLFFGFNFIKYLLKAPFSSKNRKYFLLLLTGISPAKSLKHRQKIKPFL